MFTALYADSQGNIYDAPGYEAVGRAGTDYTAFITSDLIPLPDGADLMFLPQRTALAYRKGKLEPMPGNLLAVAAILPVGYTRTHLPAFVKQEEAQLLPLYGYAAVALYHEKIYVAAQKTDDNAKWHPYRYNTKDLKTKVAKMQKLMPDNRIVSQLANCSLKWHCCTAQNLFYHRWEAGIPASPVCNANCLGCISLQPSECCPSSQNRIDFRPTPEEIAQVGIYHLKSAPEPIISFGQGCEGEPSLAAQNIAPAIKLIRNETSCGIININTNAGYTEGIKKIVDAGIDSMRVSIISALPEAYHAYYRANYQLDNVIESIIYAKSRGVYVSLNMLFMPGFNDRPEEFTAWKEFINKTNIDMIQFRNLNIDPDWFFSVMPLSTDKPIGVKRFIDSLKEAFPRLTLGSFSPYVKQN